MAETTFRFIYDSVAATTATSEAGGSTSGKSSTTERSVETGSPSRINNLLKQSQKSVQEGIKGGMKQLGIAVTLGNMLKQSQVFTSSLNAIFQIIGAFFDILLAPLMPYFARMLKRWAPNLLEWAEKMGRWIENLYIELQGAESLGAWIGEAVAKGLVRGVMKALGLDYQDPEKKEVEWGETYDPAIHNKPGGIHAQLPGMDWLTNILPESDWMHKKVWSPFGDFDIRDEIPKWMLGIGFGKGVSAPLGPAGSGRGGAFGTGLYSGDQGFWENTREVGDFVGSWWDREWGKHFPAGGGGGIGGWANTTPGLDAAHNQTDVANTKHNQERKNSQDKEFHFDFNQSIGSWSD
jgi:hypothetical protein